MSWTTPTLVEMTRNQRLLAGRVLISIHAVLKQSPSALSRRALAMQKPRPGMLGARGMAE
jgi:hypothetical protein